MRVEWEGLEALEAVGSPEHPFLDRGWLSCWWDAFGDGEQQVAVARRDGRVTGALPLYSHRGRLAAMANYHSAVFAPLGEDAAAVLEAACARPEPELFLNVLRRDSLPPVRAAAGGRRLLVEPDKTSPIVDTTGDPDAYAKTLGSTLRRRRRKLQREHEVELRLDDGGEDLAAALELGFAIEASGWKTRNGTAILSHPNTRAFYTALARAYRARGELVLGTLTVDGRAVAWHFTLRRAGRLYMLKTGYLEDAAKSAPGLMLHLLTIEHCFADPAIEAYELLGHTERWKREFATSEAEHVRVRAYRTGPSGMVRHLVRRHAVPLAKRARDRVRPPAAADRKAA
jgi:CelD/BcsL family acetyltransferase involved in cellulose biosynthesis